MKNRNMKTNEILADVEGNGGFDNFNNWTQEEITEWVKANYPCSDYVAKNTASWLTVLY